MIITYLLEANIGMGLDHQNSPWEIARAAGAFFLIRDPEVFRKHSEVQSYCRYIEKQNPDVIFLTEVCGEDQKDDICDFLESKGYHLQFMRAFELHNMNAESHRFLYNIIASKTPIITHNEFQSKVQHKISEKIYSFSRIKNRLGKTDDATYTELKTKKFVGGILDGAGAHCEIDGIHFGLLHAHGTSSSIIENLRDSLPEGTKGILGGDFNVTQEKGKMLAGERFSYIEPNTRTFPYYGQNDGIISRTIHRLANNSQAMLSHPDQFYKNSSILGATARVLGPREIGLGSDHAVTHVHIGE
ncbi:hypothetical protein AUK10_03010 [Candidatus Gracilibacteria bacterium CG2_30_37_12]|nr:MAG: hypothetical protein AUK10_03010 [Candidatus Gracilibacteria bacterium CG2_30_37_12]